MKNKLYILHCGTMGADKNMCVMGGVIGTKNQTQISNVWVEFPIQAFLIETEQDGCILFDTGANPRCMDPGYWPETTVDVWPTTVTEDQRLENQLAKCGVTPEDIQTVVLSHMHQDHMGNIGLFRHADVYVAKAEFEFGHLSVSQNPDPRTHGGYIREELLTQVKQYHLVDEEFEIAPGVEVIRLPGHTPDQLGLVVHAENGVYLLPADALYGPENYGPPARLSCCFCDSVAFLNSIEKVRKIAERYQAKIFFSHDSYEGDYWKTLRLAPDWYD